LVELVQRKVQLIQQEVYLMDGKKLQEILNTLKEGGISVEEAIRKLKRWTTTGI